MLHRVLATIVTLLVAVPAFVFAYVNAGFTCFKVHPDRLAECLPYKRALEVATVSIAAALAPALVLIWTRSVRVRRGALALLAVCLVVALLGSGVGGGR